MQKDSKAVDSKWGRLLSWLQQSGCYSWLMLKTLDQGFGNE